MGLSVIFDLIPASGLMLTAAECREKAYQKMIEAKSDRVLGKKLEETAEAWLALADQIERADLLGTFAGPKAKK